jgi:phage tail sheath protein FI
MIEQCELLKDRVAILEVPLAQNSLSSRTVQGALDWRSQLASDRGFAALYHPWVRVLDPLAPGSTRLVPPSGHLAGVYARTDLARGVHKAPANEELLWAEDLPLIIDDRTQAVLNPRGIDALRAFPGRGLRAYGGRTISTDPAWRYVNVRRLLSMIEVTLRRAMQWTVFEPNDWPLRRALVAQVTNFLGGLWRRGALSGRRSEEAFFVRCDETNNAQAAVDNGRLVMDVGVAPTIPAEFVVFRIGRTAEELEIVEE